MIKNSPSVKFELISQMISDENNVMSVSELCKIAGVSRSGYYRWVDAAPIRVKCPPMSRQKIKNYNDQG